MTSEGADRLAVTRKRQQLRRSGFHPIPVNGKAPSGVRGWQTKTNSNDAEIAGWVEPGFFPDHLNTGILTYDTPAIDIDIDDPDAAAAIEQLIRDAFEEHGTVLTRFGREPRRAVVFRTDTPFKKLVLNLTAPNGKTGQKIEIMGNGQQLVAHGIHPDIHAPYRWYGGEPGEVPRHALPLLNEADARDMLFRFAELLCKEHGYALADAPLRPTRSEGNGSTDWGYFLDNLIDHDSDTQFAMSLLRAGMSDGAAVNFMRAAIERLPDDGSGRKQRRLTEIPAVVASARRKLGHAAVDNVVPMAPRKLYYDEHQRDVAHIAMLKAVGHSEAIPYPQQTPEAKPPVLELRYGHEAALPQPMGTIIKGILHAGSLTLFYGPPKSGKSFLVTSALREVAGDTHREWMGHAIVKHGPVLYVACEGHAGFWKRLRADEIDRGQPLPDRFVLATGRPQLIHIDPRSHAAVPHPHAVLEALERMKRDRGMVPIVVAIDTVFRSVGSGNVNQSDHMNAYLAALSAITDQGIALVAVHHETKAGGTPAGSVSMIGGSDTLVKTDKREDGTHAWSVEMAKDDEETEECAFSLEVVNVGEDSDGQLQTSCIVRRGGEATKTSPKLKPEYAEFRRLLMDVISERGSLIIPFSDGPAVRGVARKIAREYLIQNGFFHEGDLKNDGSLLRTAVKREWNILRTLKNNNIFGFTTNFIWLI